MRGCRCVDCKAAHSYNERQRRKKKRAEEENPIETKTANFKNTVRSAIRSDHDTFTLAELKRARGWKPDPGWEQA